MVSIKGVTKKYGDLTAVNNLSLEIRKNEIFGIIGLSGAGKSTLVRLLNRLEECDSGEVLINGFNITTSNEKDLQNIRKKVGMIFQSFNLLSSRDVKGNVSYPLEIAGWNKKDISLKVDELLELVGLSDKKYSRISKLSGGQKQRVAIARALANEPQVLLCDEATSALDPQTTKSILNLIRDIQKKYGLTVILITHQMEVIKEICDSVALMEKGEIIEQGSVEDIFTYPKTDLAKEFVDHIKRDNSDYMEFFKYKNKPDTQLLKLHFNKETAGEPVIHNLIKNSSAIINILAGDIFRLTSSNVGQLVIEIQGSDKERDEVHSYLRKTGIKTEVLDV